MAITPGLIEGTVEGRDGTLIEGATVEATRQSDGRTYTAQTDSNGAFSIDAAAGGVFHVTVRYRDPQSNIYRDYSYPYVDVESAIPDSAILQTKLDEGSGTSAADAVGSNTATLNGDPQWISNSGYTGGYGLALDGSGDYLSYESTLPEITVTGTWAVGVTVVKDSSGSDATVWNHALSSSDMVGVDINSGSISVGLYDGSYNSASISEPSAPYRIRVCAGANSGSPEIFVDTTEGTGSDNPALATSSGFNIGANTNESKLLTGDVDNLIAYNVSPSAIVQDDYDLQNWS